MSLRSLAERLVAGDGPPLKRLVLLSNFEAEQFWADPLAVRLPRLSRAGDVAMTNRLEEMTLFLAGEGDAVILRETSDPEFLGYLSGLGFGRPEIIGADAQDPVTPITEAVLRSERACARIRDLAAEEGTYLLPFAVTHLEETLALRTGAPVLGASAAVSARVNSKVYSRRLVHELGLRAVPGCECESIDTLEGAYEELSRRVRPGASIVLKEAMGVSGKGLVVLPDRERFERVLGRLRARARGPAPGSFVLEEWIRKSRDINYQFFVDRRGRVERLGIKEILTSPGGVHLGHRFPPPLTAPQREEYEVAAEAVGRRLYADGFVGLAGIDSIIDESGTVYPVLEINARLNMSTYQMTLEPLIGPGCRALARYYTLRPQEPLRFGELLKALGPDLLGPGRGTGVVVMNAATARVSPADGSAQGRLYVLLAGKDDEDLAALGQRVCAALEALACPVRIPNDGCPA